MTMSKRINTLKTKICVHSHTLSQIWEHMQGMYFVFQEKKETEDSYLIEVSTLQFDPHPINVPGIAFAQLEKIGFSG